jgi:hypothetical protein
MPYNQLSQEELAQVASRAHEIEAQELEAILARPDAAAAFAAMEEAGIGRTAAVRAIRERLFEAPVELSPGALVLTAKDGWFFPAKVEGQEGSYLKIRYMAGLEARVLKEEALPFDLHPGKRVHSLYGGMWCEMEVTAFNPHAQTVQLNYYGTTLQAGLDNIKIKDKRNQPPLSVQLSAAAERAAYALAGGVVVFVLMQIFSR